MFSGGLYLITDSPWDRHPGRCCFYATYDAMAAGATEASVGGFYNLVRGKKTAGPGGEAEGGWASIMRHVQAEDCQWDDFSARLDFVSIFPNNVCFKCAYMCVIRYGRRRASTTWTRRAAPAATRTAR